MSRLEGPPSPESLRERHCGVNRQGGRMLSERTVLPFRTVIARRHPGIHLRPASLHRTACLLRLGLYECER